MTFADEKPPYRGPRNGAIFVGEKCKIEINRNKFTTNPRDFVKNPPPPGIGGGLDRPRLDRQGTRAELAGMHQEPAARPMPTWKSATARPRSAISATSRGNWAGDSTGTPSRKPSWATTRPIGCWTARTARVGNCRT